MTTPRGTRPVAAHGLLAAAACIAGFLLLAFLVGEGRTDDFDRNVLMTMRSADDPSRPIGPFWLRAAAIDATALGSFVVIGLVAIGVVGFLWLQRLHRVSLFVLVASAGGWLLNTLLKELFDRARPDVVPHLSAVMTTSFPSGHAMTSAAVYLTLGALLARIAQRRATKVYCMSVAVLITALVGWTRVFLGVHYPTDVLAGWLMGTSWALLCWATERSLERRAGLRREIQAR